VANGLKADLDAMGTLLTDDGAKVKKIVLEPSVGAIKVAVTQDAKDAKTPDFIVNLKSPLSCKEAPAVGSEYGLQSKGEAELDGTYDTYRQIPAVGTTAQTAEIVLRDATIQAEKKKVAPAHKPAAGHKAPAK
jgi:hypothetical protein